MQISLRYSFEYKLIHKYWQQSLPSLLLVVVLLLNLSVLQICLFWLSWYSIRALLLFDFHFEGIFGGVLLEIPVDPLVHDHLVHLQLDLLVHASHLINQLISVNRLIQSSHPLPASQADVDMQIKGRSHLQQRRAKLRNLRKVLAMLESSRSKGSQTPWWYLLRAQGQMRMTTSAASAKKAPTTGQKSTPRRQPSQRQSQSLASDTPQKTMSGMKRKTNTSTTASSTTAGTMQQRAVKGTTTARKSRALSTSMKMPGRSDGMLTCRPCISLRICASFRQISLLRQGSFEYSSPQLQQNSMPHLQLMYSHPAIFSTQMEHLGHLRQLSPRIAASSPSTAQLPSWAAPRHLRQCGAAQAVQPPVLLDLRKYPLQSFCLQAAASLLFCRKRKRSQLSMRAIVAASRLRQMGLLLLSSAWQPSYRHLAFAKFSACERTQAMQQSAQKRWPQSAISNSPSFHSSQTAQCWPPSLFSGLMPMLYILSLQPAVNCCLSWRGDIKQWSIDHCFSGVDLLVEGGLDAAAREVALDLVEERVLGARLGGIEVLLEVQVLVGVRQRAQQLDAVDQVDDSHQVHAGGDQRRLPREAVLEEGRHLGREVRELLALGELHQRRQLLDLHLRGPLQVVRELLADVLLVAAHHLERARALLRRPEQRYFLLREDLRKAQLLEDPPRELGLCEEAGEDGAVVGVRLLRPELPAQLLHEEAAGQAVEVVDHEAQAQRPLLDLRDRLLVLLVPLHLLLVLDALHVPLLLLRPHRERDREHARPLDNRHRRQVQDHLLRLLLLPLAIGREGLVVVQVVEDLGAGGPVPGGLGDHAGDEVVEGLEGGGEGGDELGAEELGVFEGGDVLLVVLEALLVDVGVHLGEELVHHHAQRVDVGLLVGDEGGVGELLEGHVLQRALAREGGHVLLGEDGEAEVGDLEHALAEEHVGELEVLVQDAVLPQHAVAAHQLPEGVEEPPLLQQPRLPHPLRQRALAAHLHEDVEVVLGEALHGQHAHQVGVRRQQPDDVDLALDLLPLARVAAVGHDLHRQLAGLLARAHRLLHHSEPALAQLHVLEDQVLLLLAFRRLRHHQLHFLLHIIYICTCSQTISPAPPPLAVPTRNCRQSGPQVHQWHPNYLYLICSSYLMEAHSLPVYRVVEEGEYNGSTYSVLTRAEHELLPEALRETFLAEGSATHAETKTTYLTPEKAGKTTISASVRVAVSSGSAEAADYLGSLSDFLSSAYRFSRKSKQPTPPTVSLLASVPLLQRLLDLVQTRNQTREWGNGRGDVEGTPQFFRAIAEAFAKEQGVEMTVISGDELLKEGFRLLHAVGRASRNEPVFVNLSYKGDADSSDWVAFVGKGVCFDSGGLNIKTAGGMLHMFLDKCGAMTVLAAFQTIVRQKLRVNLTCSVGLVENFISENSYRPSDIITSRKGLTVEIGNTDAEGRLVLADCMHWTQEKYKTSVLIELSTLTGAVITALGSAFAGLFTNDEPLAAALRRVGDRVHEHSWHMPCTDYHTKLVSPKHCDLTNSSGKTEASSSQAAAFLKSFVEEGVKWVHLDVAGTAMVAGEATGWGSRLLVEYAHELSQAALKKSE